MIADGAAVEAWLVEATIRLLVRSLLENGKRVPAAQSLAWSDIPALVYIPKIREDARRTAEALHPIFPRATTVRALYGEVWRGLAAGKIRDISLTLHPALGSLPQQERERAALHVCNGALVTLLQGTKCKHRSTRTRQGVRAQWNPEVPERFDGAPDLVPGEAVRE